MKINKLIKLLIITTIIIFIFSYTITNSGYYEYNLYNKKNLTEDQIKEFEKDIKKGERIDINKYLNNPQIDYSNKLTKATSNASIKLNNYLKKVLIKSFHILEKLVK